MTYREVYKYRIPYSVCGNGTTLYPISDNEDVGIWVDGDELFYSKYPEPFLDDINNKLSDNERLLKQLKDAYEKAINNSSDKR